MAKRFRMLVISDLHCGNVLGTTPPEHQTERTREWLGPLWERLLSLADQIGTVDALVANGDLIDGPGRKDSTHHITTDILEQTEMAEYALSRFKTRKRFVVRGTGFHTDANGALENVVAQALNCEAFDELRIDVHGLKFNFRHVIGRSDTPYGQYTQAGKEMINDQLQAEMEAYDYADLLGRAHVHYCTGAWRWNTARNRKQEVWTNPAMELRGPKNSSYVRKLRTWMYHVGAMVITVWPDGEYRLTPAVWPLKVYAPTMREYICLTNESQK